MDERVFINETLINKLNIGIVYFDASGKPIYSNKAADRIFGLTIEKFKYIGSPEHGFELIDYDGNLIPIDKNPIEIVKKTKKPVNDIIAGVHNIKTRHTNWILFEAEPEFAADGITLERILSTVTNISSQISIEKKLRFQNKLQSLMMKTAKTYLGDLQDEPTNAILNSLEEIGRFTESDSVYIFEYDFDHQLLSNTYEWCDEGIIAQKDNIQLIPIEIAKDWVEQHSKGLPVHIPDVSALNPDNSLKNRLEIQGIQSCITVPIMQGKKCLGFVGLDTVKKKHFFTSQEQNLLSVFAEILVNMQVRQSYNKQIKESERKYREITENVADLIWTTDRNFNLNYCSPSIKTIFGYEPEEYISGSLNDQFSAETVEKYLEIVREFRSKLKNGTISTQDKWSLEGQAIKKNGQVFWFKSIIKPSWNAEYIITGVL